jgi:NAD(P)-dependent dehydrogenase (short-subunit alcohol dehydrogenase family)
VADHLDATYPDLAGRSALVTGGARGIGLAIATSLARSGMRVALADLSDGVVAAAEELAATTGVRTAGIVADVTDGDSVDAALDRAAAAVGSPTVLVNSAGIALEAGGLEMSREQWDRVMAVNVTGTFLACRAFARACVAAGATGSIVNVASMSARIVNVPQQQSAYNASKAAVEAMTRSLAVEWLPHGIRVNAVSPGYILTDMTRDVVAGQPERARLWRERIPAGEMGSPEDVAGVVAFLASDRSRYVVGQSIVVDGGYTIV